VNEFVDALWRFRFLIGTDRVKSLKSGGVA
jgi:hypothetical protein